ncbi:hypothetical protein OSTOST_11624, partial [Ostertagia ostertagi]
MLPKLGPPTVPPLQLNHYQNGSLSQQLAAPSMQPLPPVMSPPAMYIDTKQTYLQTSPEQGYMLSPGVTYSACQASTAACMKVESPVSIQMTRTPSGSNIGDLMTPSVPVSPTASGTTTKEELLRLLVNMSPGQVERLKGGTRPSTVVRARPSAVATRVLRDEVWPQDDDSDDEDELATDEPRRKGPKTERRTAHNLNREEIPMLHQRSHSASENHPSRKSATLRKAIEHIGRLEAENQDLRLEVQRLVSVLHSHNIEVIPPAPAILMGSPTLSPSTSSASIQSPGATTSPRTSPTLPLKGAKRPRTSMEQGRVTIFAIMFAMLMWNPLGLLATGSSVSANRNGHHEAPPTGGRVISEVHEEFMVESFHLTEIHHQMHCRDATARVNSLQSREVEASILERPLPSAGVEQALSVVWQIIRHALNSLWIGRWFSRRKRDAGKPVTVVCKSHAHTAMIYHKMHQLHLLGVDESNEGISGLYLALSAVTILSSVLVTTGLQKLFRRTRLCLPPFLASIFSPYFYRRARRHVRRADEDTVNGLLWVFHPLSREFLSDAEAVRAVLSAKKSSLTPIIGEC